MIKIWMASNNAFAARTGIAEVVVKNESNMASYQLPEAGNLNGSNADLCSDVTGECLSFQIGKIKL